jgi:hypothetical protein
MEALKVISKDEASGVRCPGIPEGITAQDDKELSLDIRFPPKDLIIDENVRLKARVRELEARVRELEGDLQVVFLNTVDTFEAVATSLKDQAVLRGRDLAEFMEPAREAAKEGDTIRVLAYARQGVSKLRKALQDSPVPAIKAIAAPEKPRLIAVSKIELRAVEIKERIEESGLKTFSSRDARQYIAGVEGEEPSRRDTIRALKQTVKMLPQYALEIVGGISRLICRDTRPPGERAVYDEAEKKDRNQWQRQGLTVALPWLDPQGLRANVGRA